MIEAVASGGVDLTMVASTSPKPPVVLDLDLPDPAAQDRGSAILSDLASWSGDRCNDAMWLDHIPTCHSSAAGGS